LLGTVEPLHGVIQSRKLARPLSTHWFGSGVFLEKIGSC
jgi:hypothetical protein